MSKEQLIIKTVNSYFDTDITQNLELRERETVYHRQLAHYLTKKITSHTYSSVGKIFDKNHATIINSVKSIEAYLSTDNNKRKEILFLKELILTKLDDLKDRIVAEVRLDLKNRSETGIRKYGTTLDRKDLALKDWLNHAYEETLDKALYLKRAIKEIESENIDI